MQQFPNKSSVLAHSQLPNKAADRFDPFFIPCYFQTKLGWKRKTFGRKRMLNLIRGVNVFLSGMFYDLHDNLIVLVIALVL